ncbi:RimJ/RimL family protein N-acetyltransferase [Streptomyces sp. V3I8]|uniref:GNAT family N-acetyltransferase n=1 Tax=Streptomyces sp. V3I8 TaxID=3042279 RepID=UPI00277EC219|nr:GNAT family N-acetyltransferase [Streptomyces sp. V3I8]MDQ1037060.1 RimJ/RimL family protein N-acetyltransferase [Streptomyces sp. V3I8]
MRAMGGDQVEEAVSGAVAALRGAADRDWGVRAGRLEWSCRRTAEHIASDLISYAGQLAGRSADRYVPFRIDCDECESPEDLLQVVEATGALLAAAVRTTPREVRAFHPYPFRGADREGFAAMGVTEVLVHAHDVAEGLGIAYEPPAALCADVLTRIFPHVRPEPGPDHWRTLLWATGRGELPGRPALTSWHWSNTLVVPAERLTLQGVTPAAAADLRAGGTGGFEWITGGPFQGTRDAAGMVVKAYEAGVHRPEWGMFVLVRREDGRAVGGMGFHGAPDGEGRAEVGYDLAESARGNGYATEALRALSAWALAREDLTYLFATVDRANVPSQGVISRVGFTEVGTVEGEDGEQYAYELRG